MHAAVDTSCLWKANIIWVVCLQTAGAATATFLHDRASPRKINGWIFHQAVPLASLFLLNDTASRQHMLVHSVLANVLDSRAAAEGDCIFILRINSTWHKWSAWVHGARSACNQAGERQGFVLSQIFQEGLLSCLQASVSALEKMSHHLLIYFSLYFPSYWASASSSSFHLERCFQPACVA